MEKRLFTARLTDGLSNATALLFSEETRWQIHSRACYSVLEQRKLPIDIHDSEMHASATPHARINITLCVATKGSEFEGIGFAS